MGMPLTSDPGRACVVKSVVRAVTSVTPIREYGTIVTGQLTARTEYA
jgi:hypothetical protein